MKNRDPAQQLHEPERIHALAFADLTPQQHLNTVQSERQGVPMDTKAQARLVFVAALFDVLCESFRKLSLPLTVSFRDDGIGILIILLRLRA